MPLFFGDQLILLLDEEGEHVCSVGKGQAWNMSAVFRRKRRDSQNTTPSLSNQNQENGRQANRWKDMLPDWCNVAGMSARFDTSKHNAFESVKHRDRDWQFGSGSTQVGDQWLEVGALEE
uniref:Uncharacterized protein n=1 Tax=Melanopsichium pennsylvanicum 4 TaxID=1398559 RepID=A0A077R6X9_9BASI|nr:uncharacterized protein BN887_06180 [Melanopsichium pennsylvanicum 4]